MHSLHWAWTAAKKIVKFLVKHMMWWCHDTNVSNLPNSSVLRQILKMQNLSQMLQPPPEAVWSPTASSAKSVTKWRFHDAKGPVEFVNLFCAQIEKSMVLIYQEVVDKLEHVRWAPQQKIQTPLHRVLCNRDHVITRGLQQGQVITKRQDHSN